MPSPAASLRRSPSPRGAGPALLVLLFTQSGCTSALSTALLRDMPWAGMEHAAEADKPVEPDAAGDDHSASTAAPEPAPNPAETAAARTAAIAEAMRRLSGIATLDAPAEAALVEILRGTPQEDWPVVIEEFTASLAAAPAAAAPLAPPATEPPAHAAPAPAADTASAAEPAVVALASVAEPAIVALASAVEPAAPAAAAPAPAAEPVAVETAASVEPSPAALTIRNACFASRVRGWGAVDRFAEPRFRPGQEMIVYFELDNLAADETAAGLTTRIDTSLRLVDAAGAVAHAWSFEPIAETCPSRRRDYFARYLVRLPDGLAAGNCRFDLAVTDTLARVTATASLPCEVAGD